MSVTNILLALQPPDRPVAPDEKYVDPGEALYLLNIIAWCATAAGVGGVIYVGIQLALQMQRGVPGEGASYAKGLVIVLMACVLASTAGPIVQFLGPFNLQ